jgi:hypothetical protein
MPEELRALAALWTPREAQLLFHSQRSHLTSAIADYLKVLNGSGCVGHLNTQALKYRSAARV